MKLKLFAATSALLGATLSSPAQSQDPGQAEQTPPPATEEQAAIPGADEMESARELTKRIDHWADADSEEVSMDEVPAQAREAVRTVAEEAEIGDTVKRLTKDDKELYVATLHREGQGELKLFVTADGEVRLAKGETTFDQLPAVVRQGIERQAGNQSPENVYRLMAEATTIYAAKVKGGEDMVKIITVTKTGEHIATKTMTKSEMKDD